MASLREKAACIGITGDFSLVGDFFGYLAPPQDLSVLTQIDRLQGRHVHINLIRVGIEAFTPDDEASLDFAVQQMRDMYAQVSLGVGRVLRFSVTTADANGRDHIGSDAEAEALTNEWSVPNDAIDVFLVRSFALGTGLSPTEGTCDKNATGMTGSVVQMMDPILTSFSIAHFVAHYLGLRDRDDNENLMFHTFPNGGDLTASQGSEMGDHCFVKDGC
jgi:hypothetical protein